MDENKTFLNRRRIIKGAGVAAGIGIIGGGSLLYASQPTLAATGTPITAADISVTANAEAVSEVTVTPSLTLEWADFSSGISGFDVVVKAAPTGGNLVEAATVSGISDGTATGVSSFSIQGTGNALTDESGTAEVTLTGIGLVGSGALTAASDLPNGVGDGQSATTTVDYAIEVTAISASGGNSATDTTPSPSGSFDVTLDNTGGTTTATGTIATNATTK